MIWRILSTETDREAIETLLDRRDLLAGRRGETAATVAGIIARVRAEGDEALLDYGRSLDGADLSQSSLRLSDGEIAAGAAAVPEDLVNAIRRAEKNIRAFHQAHLRRDHMQLLESGGMLGMRYVPIGRAGVYIPGGAGGSTPLISSVLMNVIPAQVAGVGSIAVCTPPRADTALSPGLLCALSILGVREIYRVGGAQAVAAMAYGTASIAPVDKIVGPGNRYVTEAKRQVFGVVGIDLLAGPSEVAIVADESADPDLIAADLLAQAEHDPEAGTVLFTPVCRLAEDVGGALERRIAGLPRKALARESLTRHGGAVLTRDLDEALSLAERMAPEHLELVVSEPLGLAGRVRNAGAVFLGVHSPEAIGDYVAGTNHVLPTNGTARFASGLGVDDFLRRMSVIDYSRAGFATDAPFAVRLAEAEGLRAHAESLRARLRKGDGHEPAGRLRQENE